MTNGHAGRIDIRDLSEVDATSIRALSHLFDHPAVGRASERFAREPSHHLLVAFVDDEPAGFVSGVEITHPDKGTEMFLNELGVDDRRRRQGIGRALVGALAAKARSLGCSGMWVLTDDDNDAALGAYRAGGADEESRHVMLSWTF
jgi:ribosomal protein S18 acetylase RimI-like enzyme